jgi:hypothetical protein
MIRDVLYLNLLAVDNQVLAEAADLQGIGGSDDELYARQSARADTPG